MSDVKILKSIEKGVLKMDRTMNYHSYDATEAWEHVNPHNKEIVKFFMENLGASGRSKKTIEKYTHNLKLFFQWVLIERNNKPFYEIKKRDYSGWFNYLVNKQNLSPARVRVLRSTVSSLSNFCENILAEDDDFETIKEYDHYIANGKVETLELFLPIRLVSRTSHYRIKVQISNAVCYLYNIERRFSTTGRSR